MTHRRVMRAADAMLQAADLRRCHGEIMRIKRAVIVPTILVLSTAGSILAGSAVPLMAAQTSVAPVVAAAGPNFTYHG
jgi:hypothetical protein